MRSRFPSLGLTLVLSLWFLFLSAGCSQKPEDLEHLLTMEQREYLEWERQVAGRPNEMIETIVGVVPDWKFHDLEKFNLGIAKTVYSCKRRPKQIVARLGQRKPPSLFARYHDHRVRLWEQVGGCLLEFAGILQALGKTLNEASASAGNGSDLQRRMQAPMAGLDADLEACSARLSSVLAKYQAIRQTDLAEIRAALE